VAVIKHNTLPFSALQCFNTVWWPTRSQPHLRWSNYENYGQ